MLFLTQTATVIAIVAVCFGGALPARAQGVVEAGKLSAMAPGGLPAGWTPLTFRNIESHTRYSLVAEGGTTVLQADSKGTASGLVRRFADGEVDLRATPILRWRWKVSNFIRGADIGRKEGDDYPARVYVLYRYDPPRASLAMRAQSRWRGASRARYRRMRRSTMSGTARRRRARCSQTPTPGAP